MIRLECGNCRELLPTVPDASIDAIISDPPYPEISRDYGRLTEAEWWDLMMAVCREARRVLKPTGSAVFILQPNSRKVGSMRGWLWRFMAWACDEWNMVQDAWWWNIAALPVGGAPRLGTMRPSLKACIWLGPADCYRDQDTVLCAESSMNEHRRLEQRAEAYDSPSRRRSPTEGPRDNHGRMRSSAGRRGGTTPFNVLPFGSDGSSGGGCHGHGASTPLRLTDWWTRYISPPGGTILDPFTGSGTTGLSAIKYGRSFVGFEQMPHYYAIASERIAAAQRDASERLALA